MEEKEIKIKGEFGSFSPKEKAAEELERIVDEIERKIWDLMEKMEEKEYREKIYSKYREMWLGQEDESDFKKRFEEDRNIQAFAIHYEVLPKVLKEKGIQYEELGPVYDEGLSEGYSLNGAIIIASYEFFVSPRRFGLTLKLEE